ncbi:uncharacterized protein [Euphorbia lathyris]|uniref:uncharacterized protein n=1 Tax=Euphorbia lathyris TaxID=212925 RepID=UPI003313678C
MSPDRHLGSAQIDRLQLDLLITEMTLILGPLGSCKSTLLLALARKLEKELKEFDSTYGPAWLCIVETSFGFYVTHSIGGFLYFSIDKFYILLFRTTFEPLDQRLSLHFYVIVVVHVHVVFYFKMTECT